MASRPGKSSSTSPAPTVPCPATTNGSSKGCDEHLVFARGDVAGPRRRLIEAGALEQHLRAEIKRVFDLGEGGRFRHHDGRRNAQPPGVIGDALGVIAGAHGGNAALALFRRKRLEAIEGAALLEGSGELPVLEFEIDVAARDARQGARMAGGRAHDRAIDRRSGGADIGEGDGKAFKRRSCRKVRYHQSRANASRGRGGDFYLPRGWTPLGIHFRFAQQTEMNGSTGRI